MTVMPMIALITMAFDHDLNLLIRGLALGMLALGTFVVAMSVRSLRTPAGASPQPA